MEMRKKWMRKRLLNMWVLKPVKVANAMIKTIIRNNTMPL